MARKPLINVNVPKVGRIKTRDVLYVAVIGAGIIAAWNWSSQIPYVAPYADRAKAVIVKVLGGYSTRLVNQTAVYA